LGANGRSLLLSNEEEASEETTYGHPDIDAEFHHHLLD
jgi:hypothetical protein